MQEEYISYFADGAAGEDQTEGSSKQRLVQSLEGKTNVERQTTHARVQQVVE